ncbi:MAG: PocR ligand-binding domain-containing protein [Candidatus Omnitrophota bacterium]|nr:PocR ligand-binding domain-containing protein [Candidatus Omnitrophota bacterium]
MFYKDINLSDLVNLAEWQKIQDSFSEVLEVTLRTISLDGKLLSRISRPSRYCTEILPKFTNLNNICGDNASAGAAKKLSQIVQDGGNFKLPFGIDVSIIPIKAIGNKDVAYIMVGPLILKSRKAESEYAEEAKKAGIDPDTLMDVLIDINVFSYNKVHSMTSLIKDIFSHMAQTEYHKKRLGEIAPEVVELDPLFSKYYEEKILRAMLKTCSLVLNADSGSIMTVDKDTKTLHIKAASKLDSKIINSTSIKIGEGIAGIAVATAMPIILPKDKDKNGISDKMKRSGIKSSMIVPFNKGSDHDVYGVINLNITRKSAGFSEKDINLVKELVNMTSIALIPLYKKPSTQ